MLRAAFIRAALPIRCNLKLARTGVVPLSHTARSMSENAAPQQTRMQKTNAKEFYCLTEKDLEPLTFTEKANRRYKNATPTKLYTTEELEQVAVEKWGSMAEVEQERNNREQKRLKRALESAGAAEDAKNKRMRHDTSSGTEYRPEDPQLPSWITERVRPCHVLAHKSSTQPPASAPQTATAQQQLKQRGKQQHKQQVQQQEQQQAKEQQTKGKNIQARPVLTEQPGSAQPKHVLYWMRTAIRGHENPALDVAKHEAKQQGLPLLVAAFVLTSHPYPTARRFKFWLEGLRDAQRELRAQELELLIYFEGVTEPYAKNSSGAQAASGAAVGPSTGSAAAEGSGALAESAGWSAFMRLASQAAVVVTEDMPVDPEAGALQALIAMAPSHVGILAVDTSCTIPMQTVKCSVVKAYIYRSATQKPRQERLEQMPYSDCGDISNVAPYAAQEDAAAGAEDHPDAEGPSTTEAIDQQHIRQVPEGLGWEPLDLTAEGTDIEDLLKQCSGIDHSVPGVTHTTGGSTAAYTRWEKFKLAGLNQYAAKRNNSMLRNAVSRQSAYHHYGMISPFKIGRDCYRNSSNGSRKFFDEFMTWRELSYAFCFKHWPDLESLQSIPDWAKETLQAHAQDPRPHLMTDDQLDKAETGDKVWDAAQYQLALTGELHNNVRMTWGKALLPWSVDADTAIKRTVYLNHKYALDGCDPCSYSGILWCYGQFDKPMGPESTPIFGKLRKRDTSVVGNKLDPATYRNLVIEADSADIGGKPAQKAISDFFSPHKSKSKS